MNAFILLKALETYLAPKLDAMPMAVRSRERQANAALVKLPHQTTRLWEIDGALAFYLVKEVGFVAEPMRPCAIFLGSMPPTVNEAASAAPFLVIQALEGEDTPDGMQNIRVALRVCIVADNYEAAENDLLNIVSQIRLWLMEAPGGVVGESFRLLPYGDDASGLPWERPDEQVPPFLQAHIFTQWQTVGAVRKPRPDMVDYE